MFGDLFLIRVLPGSLTLVRTEGLTYHLFASLVENFITVTYKRNYP